MATRTPVAYGIASKIVWHVEQTADMKPFKHVSTA